MRAFTRGRLVGASSVGSTTLTTRSIPMRAHLTILALACAVCISHAKHAPSVAEVLTKDGRFTTLLTAIGQADLLDTLATSEAITVLAPTDAAFDQLPEGTVASLLLPENRQQLADILTYHVIGASLTSATVKTLSTGQTLSGASVAIVAEGDRLLVNDASVVNADIAIANGTVHVIDRVLLPPAPSEVENFASFLVNDGRFSTLVAAAEAAGMLDPADPSTFPLLPELKTVVGDAEASSLFAPTDEAFAKLPAGTVESLLLPENKGKLQQILLYHFLPFDARSNAVARLTKAQTLAAQPVNVIVRESGIDFNNASIINADQFTGSGTVHVIDTVLIPASEPETRSFVDVLQADGRFTNLLSSLVRTDLFSTVATAEGVTLLAPTDAAFSALTGGDPGVVDELVASGQLAGVLQYHVVSASAPADVVRTLTSADTLLGDSINIATLDDKIFVNQAQVIDADVPSASNIVVHVVDSVITPPTSRPAENIPAVATADGRFQTLLAAVEAAGLVETLSGSGPFTVLAPTDDAFADVSVEFLLLPENRDLLTSILTYHVIPQDIGSSVLGRSSAVQTVQGESLSIQSQGGSVKLDDAEVLVADVLTSNGTIHAIDRLLVPPSIRDTGKVLGIAESDGRFTTLLAAVEAAGLTDTLKGEGPFTILAPSDEAFAKLPEGTVESLLLPENIESLRDILLHHVVSGEVNSHAILGLKSAEPLSCNPVSIFIDDRDHTIYVDGSKVTQANIAASNGLIHVIDTVLIPAEEPTQSIVEIAAADVRFSTLVTALTAADLVDTVNGSEALTVFAPTNEAFNKLPEGLLETLLEPANVNQLRTVLLYHVLGSEGRAGALSRLPQAPTLAEQRLNLLPSAEGLSINNAQVAIPDLLATNGVIHAIDTVLLPTLEPESRNLAQVLESDGRFKTLLAAVGAADLVETVVTSEALTILAPTDEAFAALPDGTLASLLLPENKQQLADLLLYHVVAGDVRSETVVTLKQAETVAGPKVNIVREGEALYLNQARVIQADLPASNGVIHIVDAVISPPAERSEKSLVGIADSTDMFNTLLTAVGLASLGETLNGDGPFTILAPTDEAFAKLGDDVLGSLLLEENVDQLRDILLYHVFNEEIGSSALGRLTHPFAASGAGIAVNASDAGIELNGANVVTPDLYGANGVIHVIDEVLIPSPAVFDVVETIVKKGKLQVEWQSNRTGPYRLQTSLDMQSWEDILTTNAKGADVDVTDEQRFFRVVR